MHVHQHRSFLWKLRFLIPPLVALTGNVLLTVPLFGAFINNYSPTQFTLTNVNADGFMTAAGNGSTLTLVGGNNGSGLMGNTDLTVAAAATGALSYQYFYTSLDPDPTADFAGYLVSGVFTPFQTGSGVVSFPFTAGQLFGWRVVTLDNTGEPGELTISSFDVAAEAAVPEPGYAIGTALLLVICMGLRSRWRARALATLLTSTLAPMMFAQSQQTFLGTDITGQITRTAVVNASQAALTFTALVQGTAGPEVNSRMPALINPPVIRRLTASSIPGMQSLPITNVTAASSFLGLTHRDQRLANNGNQYSVEPPNPSVAVANGYVLLGVNNAIEVYSYSGAPRLPAVISSNQLFNVPAAINRSTGVAGVFPTDMRVFYDPLIDRWFVIQRAQDRDMFGNPLDQTHLFIAASQTNDPTQKYNIYSMNTTNTGHFGCPCIPDYPQIGADQYGLYISTNEYSTSFGSFVDARILALSKSALAAGALTPATYDISIPFISGYEKTIHPATTPPGASPFLASGGVEYFASTQARYSSDSTFAIWALTNTASLATAHPNLTMLQIVVSGVAYGYPDVATQKPGPLTYGSTLSPAGRLAFIDGVDTRIQSLVYAGGRLYATLATTVTDETGRNLVGGAYTVFSPTYRIGMLSAPALRQGYLLVKNNHLLRPAVAVNRSGRGAIVFTLVGPDYFPTVAFVPFDTFNTGPAVQIVAAGDAPEDGFSGYPIGGGVGVARWGDYASAVAAPDGSIWMTTEFTRDALRTTLANWATQVARYLP